MADVEDLKIILRAEVDKAISDLKKASREGKNAQRDWDNIAKSFQDNIKHSLSLKNAFSQLSMQIAGGLAIYNLAANAISALSKTFKESVQEYSKASEEHARLEAQIRATGGAAGYTANQLENMATELQTTTKISENEVRAAQSSLLKFTSITGDAFKKATELSLDLAKTMGTDTASAAQMLGRAIENPAEGFGALRRSGIILTESQEKLAKAFVESGDKAKAQEIVLQAVADRVGGVAKAIGNDDPAGLKRLGIAANEAKEHLGKMVAEGISPVINKLADLIERSNNAKDAINNLNAALRGEGDYDSIKAAYEREKKTLEALKASLAGADIVEQAQIEKQIADVEARIAQLSEMLRRKAQTASGPSSGTKPSVQNEKDEKAAEYIKSVNDELAKNIQAIKLRASALGQEASSQELLTQYLNAYVKLIQGSNGLVTENNPAAKLLKIQIQALVNGQKELSQAQALAEYQMEKAGEIEGARYNAAYEYWKAQQAAAKAAAEQQEREAQALAEYQMEKAGEIEAARYLAAYLAWLKKQQLIEDEKKKWEDYYKYLKSQAEETAKKVLASGLLDLFNSIGAAMASGASSADAAEAAMRKFFQTALQQTSMLALNAGLKLLVEGGLSMLPMALGLFALAGISGIAAGAIGAAGGVRQVDYDQYIVNPVIDAETELANKRVDIIKQQLDDEKKLRDENLKRIEESFNTEYEVLKDQWQRGLISTEQYKQQSANLRSQEESAKAEANKPVEEAEALLAQIEAARNQKLSYLATEAKKRQDELNSMSGWDKFWSGRDEELVAELDVLDARIKKVKEAQSLPEISAAKYGADFVTQGPKLMLVGDNPGGRERVRVEPIGTPNRYGPNSDQIIIQISGDVYGIEDLYQKLEAAGRKLMKSGRLRTGAFA